MQHGSVGHQGKVFFTSDTHFGHGNIIKYCHRPFLTKRDKAALEANGGKWHDGTWKGEFASDYRISNEAIEMMDDHLISQINQHVGANDTLYHLGDWAMPKGDYRRQCEAYRRRILCQNVFLVEGNHDHADEIADLFNDVYQLTTLKLNGINVVIAHYALAVWNKSHRNAFCFYGHSHYTAEDWLDRMMPGRRAMDVGVDSIYQTFGEFRPVSFTELEQRFKNKKGHWIDHHKAHGRPDPDAPTEEELHTKDS